MNYKDFFSEVVHGRSVKLVGGVGDATAPDDVDPTELSMGVTVEMQHTTDPDVATEIALDHLIEDPYYYSKLKKAGLAKELDACGNSSGLGDPNHPINDKPRLGTIVTASPGDNVIKYDKTSDGSIDGRRGVPPIVKKSGIVDIDVTEPSIDEDRCTDIAKRKYKKWPSAYASGAVVRCRQGKIWKKKNEESLELEEKADFKKEKSQGLHGWFARRGGKGGKGWVDCNTCRKDPKTGTKKCKSCGRQSGEKRDKYPACRPTPSLCNKSGTSRKKGPSTVSWKKKNESVEKSSTIKLTDIVNDILKDK